MTGIPTLSLLTFLPLLGVLAIMLLPRGGQGASDQLARVIALVVSGAVFVLSLWMLAGFVPDAAGFQFVERHPWLPDFGLAYHMGVDGISVYFVVLSAFLTPICILSAWSSVKKRVREYMIAFLVLETFMIGSFCALDAVLFYVFFEGVLIPMFFIIGIWGGERRVYASFKFFLYTLLGSVLMLLAILALIALYGTADIPTLMEKASLTLNWQIALWLAFFASFAVKMPMWPVHTWLPDAHVEAPTAGSVILAGVLLKMGGYGFLRFSIPMLPDASVYFMPLVFSLSIIAVIYTSLVALVQEDMKKLIAYSSVAHMGFVTLGIFSFSLAGVQGAMFQMLSHGIISAALFLCVGVVYDRMHTRRIADYGGVVNRMPNYAIVFMILMLGAVGLPGTTGFVGEFLVLMGAFKISAWLAIAAGLGVVLGAGYMLTLYRGVLFGKVTNPEVDHLTDLNAREIAIFAPMIILVIVLGVYPNPVLKGIEGASTRLLTSFVCENGKVDVRKESVPAAQSEPATPNSDHGKVPE